jgi:hypothetical protein
VCVKTGWQVQALCLMGNHFHLVVETPQGNLVECDHRATEDKNIGKHNATRVIKTKNRPLYGQPAKKRVFPFPKTLPDLPACPPFARRENPKPGKRPRHDGICRRSRAASPSKVSRKSVALPTPRALAIALSERHIPLLPPR